MTKMTQSELENETKKWLNKLNKKFDNPIKGLLKTGGEDQSSANQVKQRDSDKYDKNKNVTEELNYGRVSGTMR